MINLSSKNPVLRFKLGKKIKMFKNPNGGITLAAPKEEAKEGYYRVHRDDGTWVWGQFFDGKNFVPITKQVVLDDGTILNTNGTKSSLAVREIEEEQKAAAAEAMENALLKVADNLSSISSSKTKSTPSGTSKAGSRTRGTTATTRTKPTVATPTYTVPSEVTDVKAMLQKLLDGKFYDQAYAQRVGNRAVDGKWGKWTDEAYKRYKTATLFNDGVANQGTPVIPGATTQEVVTPYTTNFDYTSNAGLKNLGFSNYNGLLNFVGLNPTNLFARDLIERFGTTDKWNLSDIEKVLGVSGRYRTGMFGDYSDMSRSMAEWATNKNKEAAAALKQNTPPVDNNISASTPSYDYLRDRFFSTYNPTNLFPSYTPIMGTTNTNYFTTYNSGNTLLPTNSINRFKLFKKGGSIRKFQWAGQITYPKWEVPRTVATGYGFQNANDTLINLPNVTVTANYKLAVQNKANRRNSVIANLLNSLWEAGAFKGVKTKKGKEVSFHEAVDGLNGRMTREAINNALNAGFQVDLKNGTLIKNRVGHTSIPKSEVLLSEFLKNEGVSEGQIKNLKLPKDAVDRYGNLTEHCAAYVNAVLKNNGIRSYGDAYLVNSQFKNFLNGYKNMLLPKDLSVGSITNFHRKAADNLKQRLDTLLMDPDHVYTANMYYTNSRGVPSPRTIEFFNNAVDLNRDLYATHIGLIYKDKDRNQWRVTHNIHGGLKNEPLTEDLGGRARHGYGITSIADAGEILSSPSSGRRILDFFPSPSSGRRILDFFGFKEGGKLKKK